jgi:stage V sporulation protein G
MSNVANIIITRITLVLTDKDSKSRLRAYANITFNNCLVVNGLKVIHGGKGIHIFMPSKKKKDGTFRDVAHAVDAETRRYITAMVLWAFLEKGPNPSDKTATLKKIMDEDMGSFKAAALDVLIGNICEQGEDDVD